MLTLRTPDYRSSACRAAWLSTAGFYIILTGCVDTHGSMQPSPVGGVAPNARTTPINPGAIEITEGDLPNRHYVVVGEVSATGRSFNLISSNPTRADVDQALRVQAARLNADAIIHVKYRSERSGLQSRGKLSGSGQAIVFTG